MRAGVRERNGSVAKDRTPWSLTHFGVVVVVVVVIVVVVVDVVSCQ